MGRICRNGNGAGVQAAQEGTDELETRLLKQDHPLASQIRGLQASPQRRRLAIQLFVTDRLRFDVFAGQEETISSTAGIEFRSACKNIVEREFWHDPRNIMRGRGPSTIPHCNLSASSYARLFSKLRSRYFLN